MTVAMTVAMAATGTVAGSALVAGPGFHDPLETAATTLTGAAQASTEPFISVATMGTRQIAVGLRGVIVLADDATGAATSAWRQAPVPVQSDLVSVQLLDDRQAWASGHDGVILHSGDGGETWRKQLDRGICKQTLAAAYEQRIAGGEAAMSRYLAQVKLNTDGDVSLPFLGVWFDDAKSGYAVGPFGMIVASRDGGDSWSPWLDHIDNDEFLNLNSIRGIAGEVYIAGEHGMVYRLDRPRQRFVAMATGYKGSFFDITGTSRYLLAFGLRGAAYRSTDGGASWAAVKSGVERSITAGVVLDAGRRVVLLTETGQAVQSTDDGATFRPTALPRLPPVYAASADGADGIVVAGILGVQRHALGAMPR